jgi:hypothetical protein
LPKQRIVVGLWGATENITDAARRVRDSGADEVVTTLAEAVLQLAKRAPTTHVPPPSGQTVGQPRDT